MGGQRTAAWVLVVGVCLGGVGGCARYYWSKPGSTAEHFQRDSLECAQEASPTAAARTQGLVVDSLYRACLTTRGYVREKQFDPPPPGSYRGIE